MYIPCRFRPPNGPQVEGYRLSSGRSQVRILSVSSHTGFRRVWAFAARRPEVVVQTASTSERATAARFLCLTRAEKCGAPVTRCGFDSRRSPVVSAVSAVQQYLTSWSAKGGPLCAFLPVRSGRLKRVIWYLSGSNPDALPLHDCPCRVGRRDPVIADNRCSDSNTTGASGSTPYPLGIIRPSLRDVCLHEFPPRPQGGEQCSISPSTMRLAWRVS